MVSSRHSEKAKLEPGISDHPKAPVVLVLGLTGAGKTTFINHVAPTTRPVGHDMSTCTTRAEVIVAQVGGVGIILVDTPGFEDPDRSDAEILVDVTSWIAENLGGKVQITAALYVHSIATEKLYGSALQNFLLFAKIVGSNSMSNVGLVSTRWDVVPGDVARSREKQLCAKPWKTMIAQGAKVFRATNNTESCAQILLSLLESQPTFIQIQREMAREFEGKPLSRTEAGEQVHARLTADIAAVKARIVAMDTQLKDKSLWEGVPNLKEQLQEERKVAREQLTRLEMDLERVKKVPTWSEWTWENTKRFAPHLMQLAFLVASQARGSVDPADLMAAQQQIIDLQAQITQLQQGPGIGGQIAGAGLISLATLGVRAAFGI